MTEESVTMEIAKMNNTISVIVKEFNKLKKEMEGIRKENEILTTEMDRLYRINAEQFNY